MVRNTFKGRPALPGDAEGRAEVSRLGFDLCACWVDVLITGTGSGICHDRDSPTLYGRNLANTILCIPHTIGSTSAVPLYTILFEKGLAPRAMLFANRIDPSAAGGLVLGDIWHGQRIVTVDLLGDEFLLSVNTGDAVTVHSDGRVDIRPANAPLEPGLEKGPFTSEDTTLR